jgi:hypothetical protein
MIGNRAVVRLTSEAAPLSVRRYTKVPVAKQTNVDKWQGLNADLRVSDDGMMVVKDTPTTPNGTNAFQDLYAAPSLITHIDNALVQANSAFKVTQGNATIQGRSPNGGKKRTLNKVDFEQQDFANANPAAAQQTFTNCNANMWSAQGIMRGQGFTAKHQFARFNRPIGGQNEVDLGTGNAIDLDVAKKEAAKYVTGEGNYDDAKREYPQMDDATRDKQAKKLAINQFATPGIAEAYGIFRVGGGQYHMAPVIAKSGADTVTLENFAGNPGTVPGPMVIGASTRPPANPNWFVRMFGPVKTHMFREDEDQTFWGEHRRIESDDYGTTPLVTTLKAR